MLIRPNEVGINEMEIITFTGLFVVSILRYNILIRYHIIILSSMRIYIYSTRHVNGITLEIHDHEEEPNFMREEQLVNSSL